MKDGMNEKDRTHNKRFYESGGVTPQKVQYKFASTSPAATAVPPAFIKPLGRCTSVVDSAALY